MVNWPGSGRSSMTAAATNTATTDTATTDTATTDTAATNTATRNTATSAIDLVPRPGRLGARTGTGATCSPRPAWWWSASRSATARASTARTPIRAGWTTA